MWRVSFIGPHQEVVVLLRTFSTRIALPAGFFALISVTALSVFLIRSQRQEALAEAVFGSESLAGTLLLSIEHEMRVNERDAIREIVEAVGRQEGIESVRLFNKDGRITFSSRTEDVGQVVDMQAEACVLCHTGPAPTATLDPTNRSRIFEDADGNTVLGTIRVIPNEPGCQGADCHASVEAQSVLGVLDVALSMEPAEARLAEAGWQAFLFSLAAVVLITSTLYFMIARSVQRPLDTVIAATQRITRGDPSVPVPEGTTREIGILASSVNDLVQSLRSSRRHLEEWANSLEHKVAEKAQALRDAQFQIVQAEKLSSVGVVAAGIAHELNSPLMAIITFAHLVRRGLPEDAQVQEDLRMIEKEANRCAAIIRHLLDYARKQSQDLEPEPCDVAETIQEALELLKVEIQNGGVTVHLESADGLPAVEANPVQLVQIYVNLIMNAIHAMPDRGHLTIQTDLAGRWEYGHVDLPPHPGTQLVRTLVRDNGVGIPPESLPRVFDPFFTTKPAGKGSGLGLSVSLGIVQSYRGTILAASDGVDGASFTVLLPVPPTSVET
jgi:two-component system NtrC family sensor kinase